MLYYIFNFIIFQILMNYYLWKMKNYLEKKCNTKVNKQNQKKPQNVEWVLVILTRIICHKRPSTKWGFPLARSWASIFITLHPIACEEFKANVRFSCLV